ncbi:MAG: hypothetical protein ACHQHN_08005 [Sphingobacteriales bacterium]
MGTVTFKATFPPGDGTIAIVIDGAATLNFNADGQQDVQLDAGSHEYSASGAAPASGGNIRLDISGDVIAASPRFYGPRVFPPDDNTIEVTS